VITILVVGGPASEIVSLVPRHPSIEILTASGVEDALEKLARNRRIDAVLLADPMQARAMAEVVKEEDPAAPPLYASAAAGEIAKVESLRAATLEELLEELAAKLSAEG
jgi:hypothetical protein